MQPIRLLSHQRLPRGLAVARAKLAATSFSARCQTGRRGASTSSIAVKASPATFRAGRPGVERGQVDGLRRQLLSDQAQAGLAPVGHRRGRRHCRHARRSASRRPAGDHWRRPKTLVVAARSTRVKPSDIKYVAVSHTHPDHIGNVTLFPQRDAAGAEGRVRVAIAARRRASSPTSPVTKLEGDHDVFGDGSVTIISTPGHTPGHQSLLVKLPKTGAVLLSGDAVHFKDNWENRRVPREQRQHKTRAPPRCGAWPDVMAKEKGAALDQPRQGASATAKAVARVLRVRRTNV